MQKATLVSVVAVFVLAVAGFTGGAVTYAELSDTETAEVSVAAGTWTTTPTETTTETQTTTELPTATATETATQTTETITETDALSSVPAISFVAFCTAEDTTGWVDVTPTHYTDGNLAEPVMFAWDSGTQSIQSVVVKGGQGWQTVDADNATSGTVTFDPDEPADGQHPSTPCDGVSGFEYAKYNYIDTDGDSESDAFVKEGEQPA